MDIFTTDLFPLPKNDRVRTDTRSKMFDHRLIKRQQKINSVDVCLRLSPTDTDFRRIRSAADTRHILLRRENTISLGLEHLHEHRLDRLNSLPGCSPEHDGNIPGKMFHTEGILVLVSRCSS